MGRANKNAWNGFTGKIGNTVFYRRGNVIVSRQIGILSKPSTVPQLKSQQKMQIANNLLSNIREYCVFGMAEAAKATRKFPADLMRSHIMLDAISGEYPHQQIDYPKLVFSKGSIEQTPDLTVKQNDEGLEFSWNAKLLPKAGRKNDLLMVMVCFPENKTADFETNAARRSLGTFQFSILKEDSPMQMEVYASFISSDFKRVSNSQYLGQFTLAAEDH